MEKYIKKPIEVEAVKFTLENMNQVYSWASSLQNNVQPWTDEKGEPALIVPTIDGDMICSLGDYLIREPFPTDWRKLYPCKAEIFEKTYDRIPNVFVEI